MSLLELLVKELPKRGGWPEDVWHVTQDSDGLVNGYGESEPYLNTKYWDSTGFIRYLFCDQRQPLSVDWGSSVINREQYEAAIAAQQPAWNGEGLPPVGSDVEFTLDTDKYSAQGNIPENGQVVNVVAHKQTTDGNPVAVVYWDERGAGRAAAFIKEAFSPIRNEAERKRDLAVGAMEKSWEAATDKPAYAFESIYEAIAAGKIPGVELSK